MSFADILFFISYGALIYIAVSAHFKIHQIEHDRALEKLKGGADREA